METIAYTIIGLGFLIVYSIIDIKERKLSNENILGFFLVGLIAVIVENKLPVSFLGGIIMILFAYPLWHFKQIGGADSKLLIALVPFLFVDSVLEVITFMIIFAVLGSGYALLGNFAKSKEKPPLIPIITLTYVVFWFIKLSIGLQMLQ